MERKVKNYIEKYHMIQNGDTIIAGVSGGADSICLLILLCQMKEEKELSLQVVHVNHCIRAEASMDEEYVRSFCMERKLPFEAIRVNVKQIAQKQHISEEEAGRNVRYQAFAQLALKLKKEGKKSVKIAVAHNKNDVAETVLFQLFRGSGMRGMAGIPPVRDNIIRPLLNVERTEIEAFLKQRNIAYCTDATNAENIYARNKIRNELLPYINRELCENVVEHIYEAASMAQEAESFFQNLAQKKAQDLVLKAESHFCIEVEPFLKEEEIIQKYIVKECIVKISKNRKDITQQHIKDVILLFTKPVGKIIMLPYGILAKKTYTQVILQKQEVCGMKINELNRDISPPEMVMLADGTRVEFKLLSKEEAGTISEKKYTKCFDYDKISKSVKLRNRAIGDYLTINQNMDKQSLKSYMINEKIPKEVRDEKIILADDNHILWVIGHRISQYYKVTENTKMILQVIFQKRKEK